MYRVRAHQRIRRTRPHVSGILERERERVVEERSPVGVLGARGLEDGRARDEHVDAGLRNLLDVVHRHAAVDLQADVEALSAIGAALSLWGAAMQRTFTRTNHTALVVRCESTSA